MPYRTDLRLFVTLFFNDKGDREGWSESYWSRTTDYETCITKYTKEFLPIRRAMMAGDIKCELIRVSKTSVRGDTRISRPADIPTKQDPEHDFSGSYVNDTTFGNVALYVRSETANVQVHAVRPIHGIPEFEVPDKEAIRDWTPSARWVRRFNAYRDFLKADCSLITRVQASSELQISADSTAGTYKLENSGGFSGVSVGWNVIGGAMPEGQKVTVVGETFVLLAKPVGATGLQIKYTFRAPPVPTYTAHDITKVIMPFELRYRKLGRPFGLLRGARRTRKSLT